MEFFTHKHDSLRVDFLMALNQSLERIEFFLIYAFIEEQDLSLLCCQSYVNIDFYFSNDLFGFVG